MHVWCTACLPACLPACRLSLSHCQLRARVFREEEAVLGEAKGGGADVIKVRHTALHVILLVPTTPQSLMQRSEPPTDACATLHRGRRGTGALDRRLEVQDTLCPLLVVDCEARARRLRVPGMAVSLMVSARNNRLAWVASK